MYNGRTIVHVTHEAAGKVGGIGAVLQGLFTCKSYLESVNRSLVIGPLFTTDGSVLDRLGEDGEVLYSSVDGLIKSGYASAFKKIESFYNAGIVYGRRTFTNKQTGIASSPEVVLVDVRNMDTGPVDEFKRRLFEEFGVRSDLYEHLWEYEQYVRMAPVAIEILKAIGVGKNSTVVMAHEFMGMPTALAAILEPCCDFKTVFYAHEVATMRRIVENHPGHDAMFYNVIDSTRDEDLYVADVFGNQNPYFKHPLIKASKFCDMIFAVGSHVPGELHFLGPDFDKANISIVYNGVPAHEISLAEKLTSKNKLQMYCQNLLGYRPDFVFTHVTRLVPSKGLWRDLRVLEQIEEKFRQNGKTGVFFVLSTEVSQRRSYDIYSMESQYNWPVAHMQGWPDLSGGEAAFYTKVQQFNARSRNIKIIFVNQFGFEPRLCGKRMPKDMQFMDIRKGTDVEFGQSIYEPFGISQLESLTFGGLCVLSNACGCTGFINDTSKSSNGHNIIITNYTNLDLCLKDKAGLGKSAGIEDLLQTDSSVLEQIEENESSKVAKQIVGQLTQDTQEIENMLQNGYALAKNMSWDAVLKNYLLPSLEGLVEVVHST